MIRAKNTLDKAMTRYADTNTKQNCALHGLTRTLVNDMVIGVTTGFSKTLGIQGVGYRAQKDGKNLVMNLGYSHQVIVPEIDGIEIEVPDANHIVIKGMDKQKVGQFAADTRMKRPPEPYKGKGIRYQGEVVRIKEGCDRFKNDNSFAPSLQDARNTVSSQ